MKKVIITLLLLIMLIVIISPFIRNTEYKTLNNETRKNVGGDFITLSTGVTHYQQANVGANKTIVLVHGFSVPYYIWEPTYQMLKNNGYHVIRYDLLGRGYSDRPDIAYTQDLFDQQLLELLAGLKIDKPIDIIGLSMGGAIVAKFVADHPEKINKVVFIDPSHELFYSQYLSFPLLGEYLATVYLLPKAANSQMGDFNDPSKFTTWPDKYRKQMQFKGFRSAILSTLRNFMSNDKLYLYEKVGKLNIPTLLIWGKDDQTLPFARSKRVSDALHVNTFVVPDAGHIPHFERPEFVNPKLLSFIQSNPDE